MRKVGRPCTLLCALIGAGSIATTALAGSGSQITITHYDILNAARAGTGGWNHNYNGTITDTGMGSANGVQFTRADYFGGSGTLNDGIIGSGVGDTQLFANNSFASPVITLHLPGLYSIDDITLYSFATGNSIPGAIAGFDVTIGGFTESFNSSEPTDNNEFVMITGSTLDGIGTTTIQLSNFIHDGSNTLTELFAISEIVINGSLVPAPGAIALLGLAGLIGGRRRRA